MSTQKFGFPGLPKRRSVAGKVKYVEIQNGSLEMEKRSFREDILNFTVFKGHHIFIICDLFCKHTSVFDEAFLKNLSHYAKP